MIGIFDSGIGGLTILKALQDALPDESFMYYGDSAYAPYGRRTEAEVRFLTQRGVDLLLREGCSIVIIACNTASACALRHIQQNWLPTRYPDRRVLGVFIPLIEAVSGQAWAGGLLKGWRYRNISRVAFFATRRTVDSGAFAAEMKRLAPKVTVISQSCPRLAEAIEVGWSDKDIARGIDRYVGALKVKLGNKGADAAVLGCTHYPLVADVFKAALPPGTAILDQPTLVSDAFQDYLKRHPEFARGHGQASGTLYLTSGDPGKVTAAAERFMRDPAPEFRHPRAAPRPPEPENTGAPQAVIEKEPNAS